MQTRQMKAGLVLGAVFLMISGRWAAAAEGAPAAPPARRPSAVEGSTPPVERLPGPPPVPLELILVVAAGLERDGASLVLTGRF